MDRNSAIGFTLIAALLLVYFVWLSPTPPPQQPKQATPETSGNVKPDSLTRTAPALDSAAAARYGDLASALQGEDKPLTIETADLRVTFSSKGGVIRELELRKYKTYSGKPLKLITPADNTFSLKTQYNGQELDLYNIFYTAQQQTNGDTTVVTFTAGQITQTYKIPAAGYVIGYDINAGALSKSFAGEALDFRWNSALRLLEKDLKDSRSHTTINYFETGEGFDNLSESSTSTESVALDKPVKWVSVKQKFFLSAIQSSKTFPKGQFQTSMNEADTSVVKHAEVKLAIPKDQLGGKGNTFLFYFGPNDYQEIGGFAEDFKKNVYIGWPPVSWINRFVIFPVFNFLTHHLTNYGLIIVVLVFLLKLALFPLSYKSYLSMAKMKVLKPELDEIKERVGEDMTKVQQEQMKLYQQVGVNPVSGCIPVLLQMPVLFAMFYLFPASIELRQQSFWWAEDLSAYDSFISFSYAIPFLGSHISLFTVLMTATSLAYTWQNNQISSVQGPMKAMSYIMPLIFFFVLNSFAAGLTFYYTVSTLFTFAQQEIIKRFVDENKIRAILEENRKKYKEGGGTKSKFMTKLEEAMKASEEARKQAAQKRKK
jgi:YidC/Oxa1 family membrane protein insertase